jgi:Holliday junction resolvasome RuvABC endonuclease subunit
MKIITVDPGLVYWAYAVFDEDGTLIESETVSYKKPKLTQEVRLFDIYATLNKICEEHDFWIDGKIISERQFVDIMAQITGVIRSVGGRFGREVVLYTPAEWRKLATGKGNAKEDLVKKTALDNYPQLINASEHEIDTAAIFLAYKKTLNES